MWEDVIKYAVGQCGTDSRVYSFRLSAGGIVVTVRDEQKTLIAQFWAQFRDSASDTKVEWFVGNRN